MSERPFPEAKAVLGGYWMIGVKSRGEAIEWARRVPGAANEMLELRHVQVFDELPAGTQGELAGFKERYEAATKGRK